MITKKKLISAVLSAIISLSAAIPVFAAGENSNITNSLESIQILCNEGLYYEALNKIADFSASLPSLTFEEESTLDFLRETAHNGINGWVSYLYQDFSARLASIEKLYENGSYNEAKILLDKLAVEYIQNGKYSQEIMSKITTLTAKLTAVLSN